MHAFLPRMRAHGEGGHIVNTASMAGMVNPRQGFAPYPATKYAVVGMSEGLAKEVKPLGIGVSILCPGIVRTNILESAQSPRALWPGDTSAHDEPTLCLVRRTGAHWHGPCGGSTASPGCCSR